MAILGTCTPSRSPSPPPSPSLSPSPSRRHVGLPSTSLNSHDHNALDNVSTAAAFRIPFPAKAQVDQATKDCIAIGASPTIQLTLHATYLPSGAQEEQDWDWSLESTQLYGLDSCRRIRFTTTSALRYDLEDCSQSFARSSSSSSSSIYYCIVSGVTTKVLRFIDEQCFDIGFHVAFYFADSSILVLKMVGPPHEILHSDLTEYVKDWARSAGLSKELAGVYAARYHAISDASNHRSITASNTVLGTQQHQEQQHTTNSNSDRSLTMHITSSKEADAAFRPRTTRPGFDDPPTLVIEAGDISSTGTLRVAAQWWLQNSGGAVKAVLLPELDCSKQAIAIELWKDRGSFPTEAIIPPLTPSASAAPRASKMAVVPVLVKRVEIATEEKLGNAATAKAGGMPSLLGGGNAGTQKEDYKVVVTEGGVADDKDKSMSIAFRDIFLREPASRAEVDFVLTESDLQEFAFIFWKGDLVNKTP